MAWLLSCGRRLFLLHPGEEREEVLNRIYDTEDKRFTAVQLDNGEQLLFYPDNIDFLVYADGTAMPQVTSMLTDQRAGSDPYSMLTRTRTRPNDSGTT